MLLIGWTPEAVPSSSLDGCANGAWPTDRRPGLTTQTDGDVDVRVAIHAATHPR